MLRMSQGERDRLVVLRQVSDGLVQPKRGAELLGITARHFRRMRRSWEAEGDASVVHGLRDRRSNRAKPAELCAWALKRARDPVFRDFGPTLLAEHLGRDREAPGAVQASTLRLWMIEAGLWKPRRRGARHRKARPRRAAFGELIQWDSSEHAWFEDRAPGRFFLIQMHDDATNRLLLARFVKRDDGEANRQAAIDYLRRWGRPVAFYTDKAGHFGQMTRPVSGIPLEERDAKRTESVIRRALRELNVELIQAHSPQAKGRVERNFGTSQDRLVKELRVEGISTLEEANRYLEEVYIPFWNTRFAVEPSEPRDAHRKLSKRMDLDALFAQTWTRSVGNDFTVRFKNRLWQIPKSQARGIRPKHKLTVELRLDGSLHFRSDRRYLALECLGPVHRSPQIRAPKRPDPESSAKPEPKPRPLPPKPGPDHPWRRNNRLIASPRAIARHRSTTAAAQPSLPTPSAEGVP
jgi:hypothetical protein